MTAGSLMGIKTILNELIAYLEMAKLPPGALDFPPTTAGGFPTRAEITARYAERTGFDVSMVQYYRAFSSWRLAAINEGVKRRYMEGVMVDDSFPLESYDERVEALATTALELLRGVA